MPRVLPERANLSQDATRALVKWNRGWFKRMSCPEERVIAEWHVCWPPIASAIAQGACIVYAFGVADSDAFVDRMAAIGCQVWAFDPAAIHPRNWKPNVTFHHWGLLSGANSLQEENRFKSHYGTTRKGAYLGFVEIIKRLGHEGKTITAMKLDCEGCEWEVFSSIYSQYGESGLNMFSQVLTELHFSSTLRFTEVLAAKVIHWDHLVEASGLVVYASAVQPGLPRDHAHVPASLVRLGVSPSTCCREVSLMRYDDYLALQEGQLQQHVRSQEHFYNNPAVGFRVAPVMNGRCKPMNNCHKWPPGARWPQRCPRFGVYVDGEDAIPWTATSLGKMSLDDAKLALLKSKTGLFFDVVDGKGMEASETTMYSSSMEWTPYRPPTLMNKSSTSSTHICFQKIPVRAPSS